MVDHPRFPGPQAVPLVSGAGRWATATLYAGRSLSGTLHQSVVCMDWLACPLGAARLPGTPGWPWLGWWLLIGASASAPALLTR